MSLITILVNSFYSVCLKLCQVRHLSCQRSHGMGGSHTRRCPATDCPSVFASRLREPGPEFPLNASFTAGCRGSTESIRVLPRTQGTEHVRGRARQTGAQPRSGAGRAFHPPRLPAGLCACLEGEGPVSEDLPTPVWVPPPPPRWGSASGGKAPNSGQEQFGEGRQ